LIFIHAFKGRYLIELRPSAHRSTYFSVWTKTPPHAESVLNRSTTMYLPPDFSKYDAVACGKLIDQAYAQFTAAINPATPPWSITDDYTNCGSFSAAEKGKVLPFGFVALPKLTNSLS
jgi:hypothetical protein